MTLSPIRATLLVALLAAAVPLTLSCANAQEGEAPGAPSVEGTMTPARIGELIRGIDADATGASDGRVWQFGVEDDEGEVELLYVSDPANNRMRLMVPVRDAAGLSADELMRIAKANFDTALDARYAVARGTLWSVFIHPLAELHDRQFLAAVGQVVNAARTFGTTYSSGALSFGGGDSGDLRRELIERLIREGEDI